MSKRNDQKKFYLSDIMAQAALSLLLVSVIFIVIYVGFFLFDQYLELSFFPEKKKIFLDIGVVGLFTAPVAYLVSLILSIWGL